MTASSASGAIESEEKTTMTAIPLISAATASECVSGSANGNGDNGGRSASRNLTHNQCDGQKLSKSSPGPKLAADCSSQYTTEIVRSLFGPSVGLVFRDYACSRSRHSGRLYVGSNAACFYSNLFGIERRTVVRHDRVSRVEQYKSSGILIGTLVGEEYTFRGFQDRNEVLGLMRELVGSCNGAGSDEVNVNKIARGHDVIDKRPLGMKHAGSCDAYLSDDAAASSSSLHSQSKPWSHKRKKKKKTHGKLSRAATLPFSSASSFTCGDSITQTACAFALERQRLQMEESHVETVEGKVEESDYECEEEEGVVSFGEADIDDEISPRLSRYDSAPLENAGLGGADRFEGPVTEPFDVNGQSQCSNLLSCCSSGGVSLKSLFGSFADIYSESIRTRTGASSSASASTTSSDVGDTAEVDDDENADEGKERYRGGDSEVDAEQTQLESTTKEIADEALVPGETQKAVTDIGVTWENLKISTEQNYKELVLDDYSVPTTCDLEHFFDQFLADKAPYSVESYQASPSIGDTEIETSNWTPTKCAYVSSPDLDDEGTVRTLRREIAFRHKVNAPVGPSSTRATKIQTCTRYGRQGIVLDTKTIVDGVTNSDAFFVEDRMIVEQRAGVSGEDDDSGGANLLLTVRFQVRFVKSTFWKGIIQKMTKSEVTQWFTGYADMVSQALKSEQEGGKEMVTRDEAPPLASCVASPEDGKPATTSLPKERNPFLDELSFLTWLGRIFMVILILMLIYELVKLERAITELRKTMLEMKISNAHGLAQLQQAVLSLQEENEEPRL